jgi:hypothetical protein
MMQAETPAPGGPVLSSSVERHHKRIDADRYEDIYVVGDVHGCVRKLEEMLGTLGTDEVTLYKSYHTNGILSIPTART